MVVPEDQLPDDLFAPNSHLGVHLKGTQTKVRRELGSESLGENHPQLPWGLSPGAVGTIVPASLLGGF